MACCCTAHAKASDDLYKQLDKAIESHAKYINSKRDIINEKHARLNRCVTVADKYDALWNLFKEYGTFDNDSAIIMLNKCIDMARNNSRPDLLAECYVALTEQYAKSGAFPDGEAYLLKTRKEMIRKEILVDYYLAAGHLYGEMAYYTHDKTLKDEYYNRSILYRDSCYAIIDKQSTTYLKERVIQHTNNGELADAIRMCDTWEGRINKNSHEYAIMAFFRSELYRKMGKIEEQKHWLAISALCDIKNAVMDQASLWSLAEILSKEGDVERSNRYIEYSWTCTQQFNTNLRSWSVAPVLSMISTTYKRQLATVNSRLKIMLICISLLTIGLLGALWYVQKKRKQLAMTRNDLREANANLRNTNEQLNALNEQLKTANAKLKESNMVKDEYIGEFLNTCSAYVDKLDNYRLKINRKLKLNQTADLLKMTGSEQLKDDELKKLFSIFDTIFLRLFPTFISDFNKLLREDSQILPPHENTLTTDLRIFALIRLGIDESSRIADFLRYSPNSIYNYRARIKNKAVCDRELFEQKVKKIGSLR